MYAGDINDVVLRNIAPDRVSEEGESVACATMTGQQIMDSLAGTKYDDDTIPADGGVHCRWMAKL